MPDFLIGNGYVYLFIMSFLAATILPLGSEWLLVTLLLKPLDPGFLLLSATTGNVLGACTTYYLGRTGETLIVDNLLRIKGEARERAASMYGRYGAWTLLLSWVPIIGDPLCLIGGLFRTPFLFFLLLVTAGKLSRYAFIEYITLNIPS